MTFPSFASFLLLALSCRSSVAAMIGPVADLVISAAEVSPDGFVRTAALAGGTVIGPVIRGNKVNIISSTYPEESIYFFQRETTSKSTSLIN